MLVAFKRALLATKARWREVFGLHADGLRLPQPMASSTPCPFLRRHFLVMACAKVGPGATRQRTRLHRQSIGPA
jgi:hypothetical protein